MLNEVLKGDSLHATELKAQRSIKWKSTGSVFKTWVCSSAPRILLHCL